MVAPTVGVERLTEIGALNLPPAMEAIGETATCACARATIPNKVSTTLHTCLLVEEKGMEKWLIGLFVNDLQIECINISYKNYRFDTIISKQR
jgi:hypothetical protein